MDVYKDLPKFIKESGPVPKQVWLYPLCKLDSRAARLKKVISNSLVARTETFMEALYQAERFVTDIINSCDSMFEGLKKGQLEDFKCLLRRFKRNFQERLLAVLPRIRGGDADELELTKVLVELEDSPFLPNRLNEWLKGKKSEVDTLNDYLEQIIKEIPKGCATKREVVDNIMRSLKNEYVLGLEFNVGTKEEPYIEELERFLLQDGQKEVAQNKMLNGKRRKEKKRELPEAQRSLGTDLRQTVLTFISWVNRQNKSQEANEKPNDERLRFVVYSTERKDEDRRLTIQLHDLKEGTKKEFLPPLKPMNIRIFMQENEQKPGCPLLLVRWDKLKTEEDFQNVISLRVELLSEPNPGAWSQGQSKDWTQAVCLTCHVESDADGLFSSLDSLSLGTYAFRFAYVTVVGTSEFSEVNWEPPMEGFLNSRKMVESKIASELAKMLASLERLSARDRHSLFWDLPRSETWFQNETRFAEYARVEAKKITLEEWERWKEVLRKILET